jgi:glycosyltransferase involved in cell wall biosynthesis
MDGFSVIMPTYNQCAFIRRAILSLCRQTYVQWELIIVNDGSFDETEEFISDFLSSSLPIKYIKNERNKGLSLAINQALNVTRYNYISYLPSDDYYDCAHLANFKEKFDLFEDIVLVYSGLRYDASSSPAYNTYETTEDIRKGYFLSLVQTNNNGLINGKMGFIVYLYHYARFSGCNYYNDCADMLFDEIM